MEFLSSEGLRLDGRRPSELRRIRCRVGVFTSAHGSAYFEQGNTKVLSAVFGPQEGKRRTSIENAAGITCEYIMSPFCRNERKSRPKSDRRSIDMALVLKQTFEEAILVNQFPGSVIKIYVNVLQEDGGTLCASINAITLACVVAGIPMKNFVVACGAGYIDNTFFLDPNMSEELARGVHSSIAIFPRTEKVVTMQMDNQGEFEEYENVMQLGIQGCRRIYAIVVKEIQSFGRRTGALM